MELPSPIRSLRAKYDALTPKKKTAVKVGAALGLVWWFFLRGRALKIRDVLWQGMDGGKLLGDCGAGASCTTTIASAGCMETDLTMFANAVTGNDFDPGDTNDILHGAGGCFSGDLLNLERAVSVLSDALGAAMSAPDSLRIHPGQGASVDELRARIRYALSQGGMALLHVGRSRAGEGFHFILCDDEVGGFFTCGDPAPATYTPIDVDTLTGTALWNGEDVAYTVVGVAPMLPRRA